MIGRQKWLIGLVSMGFAVMVAGAGCSKNEGTDTRTGEGPAEKAGKRIDQAADKAADTLSDAALTAQVKTALAVDKDLVAISVTTSAGVVTLIGVVPTEDEKIAAGRIASDVRGVKRVDNNLNVHPAEPVQDR